MYNSTITVKHDAGLERLFSVEEKDFGRGRYTINKDSKNIVFDVEADDTTALKTVLNTIIKILTVWEKTKTLTKN